MIGDLWWSSSRKALCLPPGTLEVLVGLASLCVSWFVLPLGVPTRPNEDEYLRGGDSPTNRTYDIHETKPKSHVHRRIDANAQHDQRQNTAQSPRGEKEPAPVSAAPRELEQIQRNHVDGNQQEQRRFEEDHSVDGHWDRKYKSSNSQVLCCDQSVDFCVIRKGRNNDDEPRTSIDI